MSYFTGVFFSDSGSVDAFQRLRTSSPETLFEVQSQYNANPLQMEGGATGTGSVAPAWAAGDRQVSLVCTAGTGTSYLQSYQYIPYSPGKALRHGTPVLSKDGWINIEDIRVGDLVFDGEGRLTEVEGVFPQGERPLYRLTFDDRTEIDADGEHLWEVVVREGKRKGSRRVLTTSQMLAERGSFPQGFHRWRIPASPVLEIEHSDVLIDPYTLGVILGDGHISPIGYASVTNSNPEIVERLKCAKVSKLSCGAENRYGLRGITEHMRHYNLQGCTSFTKFVPHQYKYNSADVRMAVLNGLMDTDGTVDRKVGSCEYMTVSDRLAEDIEFLVRSLGGQVKTRRKKAGYRKPNGDWVECGLAHRITVIMPTNPFTLKRKADLWRPRKCHSYDRFVRSIVPVDPGLATCIRVRSPLHTFVTKGHVVTHNSQFIAITGVMGAGVAGAVKEVGYFDAANGIIYRQNGTSGLQIVLRSSTSGGVVDNAINQASWNVDKLDGTGRSGKTLDPTKTFILVIDLQFLGMGRVRVGFDIDGVFYLAHQFLNAGVLTVPYMQSATLPVGALVTTTATATTATLKFKCAAVQSEGGALENQGFNFATPSVASTAGNGTRVAAMSIRPKTTFGGVPNRSLFLLKAMEVVTTQARPILWELVVGATFSVAQTYADVNASSAFEYGTGGTFSSLASGLVLSAGYVGSSSAANTASNVGLSLHSPICLNRAGAAFPMGTLTLLATGIGATCDIQSAFNFAEIR